MMDNEQYYDDFDEFYCRELEPVSAAIRKLASDGNRYHEIFAQRIMGTQLARWLVKPFTGWIDDAHKAAFYHSWNIAQRSVIGAFMSSGQSGYFADKVFDIETGERVEHAFMPNAGWMKNAPEVSREKFEHWHLSGAGLRAAYHTTAIVRKVAWSDNAWKVEPSENMAAVIQARCPGWREDDGSSPELGITGSLV